MEPRKKKAVAVERKRQKMNRTLSLVGGDIVGSHDLGCTNQASIYYYAVDDHSMYIAVSDNL